MKCKYLVILLPLLLSSCGLQEKNLASYELDHSTDWNKNYYTVFDESLLSLDHEIVELDKDANKVFTGYDDPNFLALEDRASGEDALSYFADFDTEKGYGQVMKLSNFNDGVKEGFPSKLFDGQLFCHGYYEAARVQIKESGFSSSFHEELVSSDYLYLNFKSALNFKGNQIDPHVDDITINITFYNAEKGITYSYPLKDVPTNMGETYIFYGFSTKDLDLNNATSFSISYKLDKESYNSEKGTSIEHALLLYEFGFKNPTFQ